MGVFGLALFNFLAFYLLPVVILYFLDRLFHFKKKVMSIINSYFLYHIITALTIFSVSAIIVLNLPETNWITSIRVNSAVMSSTIFLLHRDKTS